MKFKILSLVLASVLLSACATNSEPTDTSEQEIPDPAIAENDRNAQRKADLQQLSIALEFYKVDNGSFPAVGGCMEDSELPEALSSYLATMPSGQSGVRILCNDQYFYQTYQDGAAYVLAAELEDAEGFESSKEDVYCGIPDADFFTGSASLSDLETKLDEQICTEEDAAPMFYVLIRE